MIPDAHQLPLSLSDATTGRVEPFPVILEARCDWQDCGRTYTKGRLAQRFCSAACRIAHYEASAPRIINPAVGGKREGSIKAAVLGILHDGEFHSAHDIAAEIHADKHSIVTRISELRRAGFAIEEDLPCGNSRRSHRYRLRLQTGAEA